MLSILGVSISAFTVSLYSLWRTTLSPFQLSLSYDSPTFTLYRITPEVSGGQRSWWIPSMDADFTFYNTGKRGGEVTDLRFVCTLVEGGRRRVYIFYAKWVVDFKTFQRLRADRMGWIGSSIERTWYPLIMGGDEERSLHIVFEGMRWDEPLTGEMRISLETYSSMESRWVEQEVFHHHLTEMMYEDTSAVSLESSRMKMTRDMPDEWSSRRG